MKLTFSPASPFARKVRIAAIELGLIDKIEFVPATVAPGQPNDEYSQHHSAEEAAGADPRQWRRHPRFLRHRRISRRTRRRRKADSGLRRRRDGRSRAIIRCCRACSIRCCCAATRRWCGRRRCAGRHGPTITGTAPGTAWRASRSRRTCCRARSTSSQIALVCVLGYADFRFADCGWRKAYPKLDAFHREDAGAAVGEDLGAAAGVNVRKLP